jgi:hypothetical protein
MVSRNKKNKAASKGKAQVKRTITSNSTGSKPADFRNINLHLHQLFSELKKEDSPIGEAVRRVQEAAVAGQTRAGSMTDDLRDIIVRISGFRCRRSAADELLMALPCATCWDEVWTEVDGSMSIFEFEIITGLWGDEESSCTYCLPLADQRLSKNIVYARQCYERAVVIGQLLRQEETQIAALFARTVDSMRKVLARLWNDEVAQKVRLQRATPEEQRHARTIFYRNVERGVRVGAGLET